jgi:hypothetical protein
VHDVGVLASIKKTVNFDEILAGEELTRMNPKRYQDS